MARVKEPPKSLFPLKHEFYVSLDEYIHRSGMLASVMRSCLSIGAIDERVADKVKEALDAFDAIRGD